MSTMGQAEALESTTTDTHHIWFWICHQRVLHRRLASKEETQSRHLWRKRDESTREAVSQLRPHTSGSSHLCRWGKPFQSQPAGSSVRPLAPGPATTHRPSEQRSPTVRAEPGKHSGWTMSLLKLLWPWNSVRSRRPWRKAHRGSGGGAERCWLSSTTAGLRPGEANTS